MIKNIAESILSFGMDFNVEEIHKTSIKILDEIGIYIGSNNGLNLLDSIGCRVDYKSKNVKIPPSIINKALSCNLLVLVGIILYLVLVLHILE